MKLSIRPGKSFVNPSQPDGADISPIALVCENKLAEQYCLDLLPEQDARWVYRHGLVTENCFVAPVRHETSCIACESLE
jgi:hypothetical protein